MSTSLDRWNGNSPKITAEYVHCPLVVGCSKISFCVTYILIEMCTIMHSQIKIQPSEESVFTFKLYLQNVSRYQINYSNFSPMLAQFSISDPLICSSVVLHHYLSGWQYYNVFVFFPLARWYSTCGQPIFKPLVMWDVKRDQTTHQIHVRQRWQTICTALRTSD